MLGLIGLIIANQSSLQRKTIMQETHLCRTPTFFLGAAGAPTVFSFLCCDLKARTASEQSFTLWSVAASNNRDHAPRSLSAYASHHIVLRAHSARCEPRIQRNASREVATLESPLELCTCTMYVQINSNKYAVFLIFT